MKQRIKTYELAGEAVTRLVGLNESLTATFDQRLRHLIDIRVSLMTTASSACKCTRRKRSKAATAKPVSRP